MVLGGGAFGRCLHHEGGALLKGLVHLYKRLQRDPLTLLPREDTVRKFWLWTRKRALTRMQPCWHLDHGLPSLQNCEQQISIVYKPPSLWYFVIAAQTDYGNAFLDLSVFELFINGIILYIFFCDLLFLAHCYVSDIHPCWYV